MITIMKPRDNFWQADTEAMVNAVNIEGVMNRGIAAEFKKRYPEMFKEYKKKCKAGELQIGQLHCYPRPAGMGNPKFIINFPTKELWRNPSELEYIKAGMLALEKVILENKIYSMAIPALGCGLGGLEFTDVLPIIKQSIRIFRRVDFLVYPPKQKK